MNDWPTADDRSRRVDGLRGIAVALVVVYHLAINAAPMSMTWLRDLMFQGRAGVWVFFVLSGYLIFLPFVSGLLTGTTVPTIPFLVRRAARIYPAYLVTLLVLAIGFGYGNLHSVGEWVQALTLTQNWTGAAYERQLGVQQAWSLALEMNFYLFVPAFAAALTMWTRRLDAAARPVRIWIALGALVVVGFGWQLGARGTIVGLFVLPNYFPAFGAGMALALTAVQPPVRLRAIMDGVGRYRGWCWLAAAGLLALRAWVFTAPEGFDAKQGPEAQAWFSVFGVVLVAATVWSLDRPGVIGGRALAWLGTISYGVFLWHLAIVQTWAPSDWFGTDPTLDGNILVRAALVVPCSIAIGAASWFLVERRCIAWGRRVGRPAVTGSEHRPIDLRR